MNKSKSLIIMIVVLISICIIVGISVMMLDTSGILNQGNLRVNDALITSKIQVDESSIVSNEVTGLEDIGIDISQNNTLTFLVTNTEKIDRIYVSNLSIGSKTSKEKLHFYQTGHIENDISYTNLPKEIEIYKEEKSEQCYIELNINQNKILENIQLPEGTKSITFDGTLLKVLDIKEKDIVFNIKFDLNIIENNGIKNVCKINLDLPDDNLREKGISISREKNSKFVFKVK